MYDMEVITYSMYYKTYIVGISVVSLLNALFLIIEIVENKVSIIMYKKNDSNNRTNVHKTKQYIIMFIISGCLFADNLCLDNVEWCFDGMLKCLDVR